MKIKKIYNLKLIILVAFLFLLVIAPCDSCISFSSRSNHLLRPPLVCERGAILSDGYVDFIPIFSFDKFRQLLKDQDFFIDIPTGIFKFSSTTLVTQDGSACIVPVLINLENSTWGVGHYPSIEYLRNDRDSIQKALKKYKGKWKLYLFGGGVVENSEEFDLEHAQELKREVINEFNEMGVGDYIDFTSGEQPGVNLIGIIVEPGEKKIKYCYQKSGAPRKDIDSYLSLRDLMKSI